MNNDIIRVSGIVEILLYDNNGNLKTHFVTPNMVVTAGKILIASRLVNTSMGVPSHMWVGTSWTAEAAAQTDLLSPVSGGRLALGGTSRTNNTITYTATFNDGVGVGALREAGIFNANTSGSMLCRTVFDQVSKVAGDILTINWNVTIN